MPPESISPQVRLKFAALDVGRTTTVRVVFEFAGKPDELAVTEGGTFRNVKGSPGVYLQVQEA